MYDVLLPPIQNSNPEGIRVKNSAQNRVKKPLPPLRNYEGNIHPPPRSYCSLVPPPLWAPGPGHFNFFLLLLLKRAEIGRSFWPPNPLMLPLPFPHRRLSPMFHCFSSFSPPSSLLLFSLIIILFLSSCLPLFHHFPPSIFQPHLSSFASSSSSSSFFFFPHLSFYISSSLFSPLHYFLLSLSSHSSSLFLFFLSSYSLLIYFIFHPFSQDYIIHAAPLVLAVVVVVMVFSVFRFRWTLHHHHPSIPSNSPIPLPH